MGCCTTTKVIHTHNVQPQTEVIRSSTPPDDKTGLVEKFKTEQAVSQLSVVQPKRIYSQDDFRLWKQRSHAPVTDEELTLVPTFTFTQGRLKTVHLKVTFAGHTTKAKLELKDDNITRVYCDASVSADRLSSLWTRSFR